MPFPSGIAYNNTELFIYTEARILVFTGIPTTNNPNAVKVLGQSTFTSATDNQGGAVGPNTLSNTDGGVFATSNKLFVADNSNYRTLIFNDDATPTPTPTLSAPTPRPTTAPGTGSSYVPNPNKHDNWSAEVNAGAQFMGEIRPLWNVEAPDASVLIQNTAVHDPLNIHISILDPFELKILPWHNGLATYGRIYSMKAISAFNGFPIYSSDEPFTVTIPYDPMLLKGSSPTQLRIAYFDRATQKWKVLKMNTVLNREAHTIANTTKQFTYFVVVR